MNIFTRIRNRLAQIDEVVPVLIFFEIIYLAVGQLIIWAFLPVDKPYVAIGFAIGVGFAMLSSIQNSMILGRALSRGKRKAASAGMVIFMLIRIAAISGIIVLAVKYKFCSPVAVLVGVLAIQAGVYFEPAVRKRRERKQAAESAGQIPEGKSGENCLNNIHSKDSLRRAGGAGFAQGTNTAGTLSKVSVAEWSKGTSVEDEADVAQVTDEDSDAAADEAVNAHLHDTELRQESDGSYEKELQKNLQENEQGQEGD